MLDPGQISQTYENSDNRIRIFKNRVAHPLFGESGIPRLLAILGDVHLTLAHIGARIPAGDDFEKLTQFYLQRIMPFAKCDSAVFRSETALFESLERQPGRMAPKLVMLDSRGRQMTSEAFAAWIGARRDEGAQRLIFAIGPASGWSDDARQKAQLLFSLGTLTLAHALARVVIAEQLYRGFTILAGHPYHTGH